MVVEGSGLVVGGGAWGCEVFFFHVCHTYLSCSGNALRETRGVKRCLGVSKGVERCLGGNF